MFIFFLTPAVLAIVLIVFVFRKHASAKGGFKDVLKNPGYWKQVSKANAEVSEAARKAKSWDDEKVSAVARHFILEQKSSRDGWGEARLLQELGDRTHLTVLRLLGDASLYRRLIEPTGMDVLPEAPFNRACKLLGDSPPDSAVQVLAPFLNASSAGIRKDAALSISKTGAPSIVPLVEKAFLDSDEYVRSYALMGLEFAMNRSGLTADARRDLFFPVLAVLRAGNNADKATDVLFRLDKEKATEYFLSEESFTADSSILHDVLKTLGNELVSVPRDRLLSLIQTLENKEMKYPWTYALSGALGLLGQQGNLEDREFLQARASSPQKDIARGAWNGLLCSYGLEDFETRMWQKEKTMGYEALSQGQKLYRAVMTCDSEINNGGLSQYFVNGSGDRWKEAGNGFAAMGMTERLAVLKEATAFFGQEGPSVNREIRQEQLAKLIRKNDSLFETLDSRYYEIPEEVEVVWSRYILEHPEDFR
jgi:HEAT repeat protein